MLKKKEKKAFGEFMSKRKCLEEYDRLTPIVENYEMTQESVKIESKDLSIEDLYKDFYTVPDFQREFVWEREQVEKLLQDVHDEFYDEDGIIIKGSEYFLGSIVVCRADDGTFSLIDGQQRMTTIYLVLCAIRDLTQRAQRATAQYLAQSDRLRIDKRLW